MREFIKLDGETIRYMMVGVLTSTINIAVFFTYSYVLNVNYLLSNLIAWVITVVIAYIVNKVFVFKGPTAIGWDCLLEFAKFVGARTVSGVFDMLLMWILVGVLFFPYGFIKIFNSGIVVLLNYILSKLMVFNTNPSLKVD